MIKRHVVTHQEIEKEAKLLKAMIERLPDSDRQEGALRLLFEITYEAGNTRADMLGLLEETKYRIIDMCEYQDLKEMGLLDEEDCEDEDGE